MARKLDLLSVYLITAYQYHLNGFPFSAHKKNINEASYFKLRNRAYAVSCNYAVSKTLRKTIQGLAIKIEQSLEIIVFSKSLDWLEICTT